MLCPIFRRARRAPCRVARDGERELISISTPACHSSTHPVLPCSSPNQLNPSRFTSILLMPGLPIRRPYVFSWRSLSTDASTLHPLRRIRAARRIAVIRETNGRTNGRHGTREPTTDLSIPAITFIREAVFVEPRAVLWASPAAGATASLLCRPVLSFGRSDLGGDFHISSDRFANFGNRRICLCVHVFCDNRSWGCVRAIRLSASFTAFARE